MSVHIILNCMDLFSMFVHACILKECVFQLSELALKRMFVHACPHNKLQSLLETHSLNFQGTYYVVQLISSSLAPNHSLNDAQWQRSW